MASLLLLRHGQILANRRGLWHGSTDSALTWRGKLQARRTARHLARHHPGLSAIYSSPLARCRQTAEQVGHRLDLQPLVCEDLREYAIGDWEGTPFQVLASEHDFVGRTIADPAFAPPGGESLSQVAERIVAAIRQIHEQHETDAQVLVVGHGAALAIALSSLIDSSPARWIDYHFANCSLTELVLSPSPYVNFFNSTQHL